MEKIFIASELGLEKYTAHELSSMGLVTLDKSAAPKKQPVRKHGQDDTKGGIEFDGTLKTIYRANLSLCTANRVLVRLGSFHASAFSELRKKAGRLPWERYLSPGQSVALSVTCHKSRLYHSDAVSERIIGAIGDRFNNQSSMQKFDESAEEQAPQLFVVRIANDICTISADSSGELLHRRGYRQAIAKAPLRETLAAGMIMASGWDEISPLIDPFCGSGTIAIEAALMARGIASGSERRFAFMDWPNFDEKLWKSVKADHINQSVPKSPVIHASDRDAGAIEMAQANAQRAGVAGCIEFSCRAVSSIEPAVGTGWIVTNPPYGIRTSDGKDLRNLYAQLGNVLRSNCSRWHIAVLCSDLKLLGNTGIKLDTSLSMNNGGVSVKLARGIVGN